MTVPPVLRFAPSPNGFLHLGHAYSALMNERVAQRLGGTLRLRFEDIDTARCRPVYAAETLADLAWLGIRWSGALWHQAMRFAHYRAALARLDEAGLLYPCVCTRGDIARAVANRPDWPHDPDGAPLYPGTCRSHTPAARQADGQPCALRLDMAAALRRLPPDLGWTEYGEGRRPVRMAAAPARWGDTTLARKDVPTSYHIAVVVDDAAQGVTDIVRGKDLFDATGLHRLLQTLLDLPEPAYHHHALIRDRKGDKLSKSRDAPTLRTLRHAGMSGAALRQELGFAAGETPDRHKV